nr:nucleotide-binding, alpha-beta plait [Tanacetum cinerariifolium]
MIEPFLITNNSMGYVDGLISCPSKTLYVTDGATVPKETPNYSIWAYVPHSTSKEYTLKTQLLIIEMHGGKTPDAYLNRTKKYTDALTAIGEPIKDKDLIMLAVSGLREEYNGLKTTITSRQSPTAFSELHALLSNHDYMLGKTRCQSMNQYFYNSNSLSFDQSQTPQFLVIHPPHQETSIEILHDQENAINSVQTFLRKFNRYSFFETPKVLLLAWDRVFKIKDAFGNKQYKPEDVQELFRELFNDVQNIHEELAEYINTPGWNRPAFYNNGDDDDEDYTIAITSDFLITDSLSLVDE